MAQELDALDPVPEQVKLQSGTVVVLEDLKARQFFKLLRIVTHGALPIMQDMSIFKMDPDADTAEFTGRLLSVMLLSIPDAEDETLEFVRSMCKPAGLIEGRKLNKADTERNNALWAALDTDLFNPELEDLLDIVKAVIDRESADIQALGKRLSAMFNLAEKTGQLTSRQPTQTSSEDSPELSTSSPTSTDGPTESSENSPSSGSGRSSRRSANAAARSAETESNG